MPTLNDITGVRGRLALSDDEGVNAALKSAQRGALARLESVLNTPFRRSTRTDLFYVEDGLVPAVLGFIGLRLTQAFVVGPVSVIYSDTLDGLESNPTPLTAPLVDEVRGVLKVPQSYLGSFMRVTYEAGFTDDDEVPEWVHETLVTLTSIILAHQQVSDGKPDLGVLIPAMERHVSDIIDRHLRSGIPMFSPVMSHA